MDQRQLPHPLSEIVHQAQLGDHDAFAHLVHRFQNMAYGRAFSYLGNHQIAQDAVQDAFWEAYLTLPKLRELAAFPGWFSRIVHKHCDRQTRRYRSNVTSFELIPDGGYLDHTWQSDRGSGIEIESIHQAIQTLSEGQRVVTILFYLQEFSYKEISDFLEIPISAVKKRLFTARKNLKERLIMDLQHELSQNKPSNDNLLAAKLQFYPALRRNDLVTIKKIIDQAPHIIHLETEWPIASNTNYWPLGVTPLYWAAGMGQQAVVELLLATGADINGKAENKTRWHQGFTPLHHAIKFHQADMVDYLIAQGADPNRQTNAGLSPFHLAAICGNVDIMDRLIAAGADQSLPDQSGQTAADWARHKENREALSLFGIEVEEENLSASTKRKVTKVFPIANLIGRAIDVEGHPLDKKPQFRPKFDIDPVRMNPAPLVLETGIKLVDLFSPLKRGGSSAVFTPLSGVGRIRIQSQIMRSIIDLHNGYVVTLSLNKGEADILSQRQQWQAECNIPGEMLDTRFINFAARTESDSTEMYRLAARAALAAEQLAKEGHEVLLWIDYPFGLLKEIVMLLESYPMISPIGSVTRLYDGDFTPGQAPAYFDDLDSIISFSYERAISQLRPSIEPLTSRCRWMDSVLFSSRHRALIKRSMAYLQRYNGLKHQYEHSGRDGLFYLSSKETDEMIVETIQRLDQYLVQPLSINEFYSAQFGQYARLDTVLNDVEAILSGSTNGLAKESLRVSLTLAEAQAGS